MEGIVGGHIQLDGADRDHPLLDRLEITQSVFQTFGSRFELKRMKSQPVILKPARVTVKVGVVGVIAVSRIGNGKSELFGVVGDVDVQKFALAEGEFPFEHFLGEMAHRLESAVEALGMAPDGPGLQRLSRQIDALSAAFEALCARQAGAPSTLTVSWAMVFRR